MWHHRSRCSVDFSYLDYKEPTDCVCLFDCSVKDVSNKEVLGVLVSYRVKVKLVVSRGGDVSVELPFVLMHPKPSESSLSHSTSAVPMLDPPIDTNLIEFDTNSLIPDDDIVFEDFARLRLKGVIDKEEDCWIISIFIKLCIFHVPEGVLMKRFFSSRYEWSSIWRFYWKKQTNCVYCVKFMWKANEEGDTREFHTLSA